MCRSRSSLASTIQHGPPRTYTVVLKEVRRPSTGDVSRMATTAKRSRRRAPSPRAQKFSRQQAGAFHERGRINRATFFRGSASALHFNRPRALSSHPADLLCYFYLTFNLYPTSFFFFFFFLRRRTSTLPISPFAYGAKRRGLRSGQRRAVEVYTHGRSGWYSSRKRAEARENSVVR